jgi:hypothetical protein
MCSWLTFHHYMYCYRSAQVTFYSCQERSGCRLFVQSRGRRVYASDKIMQNGWGRSDVRASESGSQSGSTFWPPRGGSYEVAVTFDCFALSLLLDNTHFFLKPDIQSIHTQWLPPISKPCDSPSRTPSSSSLPISMAPSLSRTAMISW